MLYVTRLNSRNHSREEFAESVASLAALRHPNVARVLRLCTEDDPWCVLSEYAADGDLCEYLRKRRLEAAAQNNGSTRLYSNVLDSGGAIGYVIPLQIEWRKVLENY